MEEDSERGKRPEDRVWGEMKSPGRRRRKKRRREEKKDVQSHHKK